MGAECSTHGTNEKCVQTFGGKIMWEGVNWIHLAQDRDHWRAVVNTVMNLRVP
jgi:hypothetical protein